jgi:hypothetical protein
MHIYDALHIAKTTTPMSRALLVPGSTAQGTRKVKNITLKFINTSLPVPLIFAVVYVPEGIKAESLVLSKGVPTAAVSLYEPAQNAIMHGQFVTEPGSPQVFHSRLARNLQSNDAIWLIFCPLVAIDKEDWDAAIDILCNYAICY